MSPSSGTKARRQPDVICAGIAVADVVTRPVPHSLSLGKVNHVEEIELHAGGCALTTASGLQALGVDVGMTAALGEDALGDFVWRTAQERGIDRGGITQLPDQPTSASVVLVDDNGERTFLHLPGCSDHLTAEHIRGSLHKDLKWLHLAGLLVIELLDGEPAAGLLREAKAMGASTSADPVWDASGRWHRIRPCLEYLDAFTPNESEAMAISGCSTVTDAANWLHDHGVGAVAITRGGSGAYVSDGTAAWHVPASEVVVQDGTGAGDCFAAGLISALLDEWKLPQAAALASVLGAVAVASVGAPANFPAREVLISASHQLLGRVSPADAATTL